ncbi:MAG TPA: MG2 domain-containing protein, partial [Flavobacteriales bacterium]|nr:MG2 domain-containing protein [Flavobacteriales bacterium]
MHPAYRGMRTVVRHLTLCASSAILVLAACKREQAAIRPDAAFTPYIPAFTAGHIPARGPLLIRITDGQSWKDTSAAALQDLFDLDPGAKGTVTWYDANTLAFRPDDRLDQNTVYTVRFHLGNVIEVPPALKTFMFQVTTFPQSISLKVDDMGPVSPGNPNWQRVHVGLHTSDLAEPSDLEKCVTAEQDGRALTLLWEHAPNGSYHRAVADSVMRGNKVGEVIFRWNNGGIGGEGQGEERFSIPALGDLHLIGQATFSEGEQYAALLFSDPLDPAQDLSGLAGISGTENVRLAIEGNKLLLYPAERISGTRSAFVAAGLRTGSQNVLGKDIIVPDLEFEELKPNVRISGNGVILPSTDGLYFPFEAVNLNAVDVRIVRIYTDNVPQFLQVNALDGERELARTGRLLVKKTIPLDNADGNVTGRWNTYHLDLAQLIKAEPGAIYRISIGFRKSQSTYPCGGGEAPPALAEMNEDTGGDQEEWDNPDQDYWYYDEGGYYEDEYNYNEREDPCSESYFRGKASVVSRNILASDIGLIAKRGNDGSLLVAASDLRTAKPMSGVRIEVLDLQRQSLGAPVTNSEGLITLPTSKHRPFLVMASKGAMRGYLKLDDGGALNVSSFDVGGQEVDKGLKGFLYGERGVWRPGDSLYLGFILQDAGNKLPKDHPVVFELSDPQGRLDQRLVRTGGTGGVYAFRCATSPDAPTGVWGARVTVGGTTFHKSIRIETVKPNRLRIALDLGEGAARSDGARITRRSRDQLVKLHSTWLHGAPARGLQARTTVTLSPGDADFKGYEKFNFNDLRTDVRSDELTVFDGTLNSEGDAGFPFAPELNSSAPAAVNTSIVTRVFEAGGDASMDRINAVYYPYDSYVGVRAPEATGAWGSYVTDTTYNLTTVALDPQGRPLAGHALKAAVVKVSFNWWWHGDMESQGGYMNAPSSMILSEQDLVTDAQGRARIPFRVDRPQWGRYVVRVSDPASGHVCAAQLYVDWPGYEGRSRRQDDQEAAMLTFNADKPTYGVGDNCVLTIPSGGTGRALVSLESGSRVLETRWVDLKEKETRFEFPVTAEMAPNVYAHVMLVQPHERTRDNDRPMRLYGVIPIPVEDKATHVTPVIAMAQEVRTDVPFNVEVAETDGKAMTYTLAIVDEGLLDLTRFKTPDPWDHFYAREALGVRTWDLYDMVIGAFGQQMAHVLALGGSDDVAPDAAAKANRFKPVVRYVGPFSLAKGKKAHHSFTISNYVGSVRVMVVATDGQRAYGNAEKTVPVRKPLMLLATLPRVAGPGETIDLPVTVFAMDPKVKNVTLDLVTNDLFTVENGTQRQLSFNSMGDQVSVFRVRTKDRIGKGTVKVTATGAGDQAVHHIELDVRQPNQPQTDMREAVVDAGRSWEDIPAPNGLPGTNSAYLEVSTIPALDLGRRLQYLVSYPHGCIEQTTSAAFPQLFLADVIVTDSRTAGEMRGNVEAGLRRLRSFQRPGGGFSYWPGGDDVNDWSTIWAGHFLVEAERAGFVSPPGMKDKWLSHMRSSARGWTNTLPGGWTNDDHQLTQAYRLYVMALANAVDIGSMNRLRTLPDLGTQARWMLAAAYAIGNRKDVAREIVQGLATGSTAYAGMGRTFGSDLRDDAVIAEALLRMDDRTAAAPVIKRIAENLGRDSWYSTQSTAWGLLAISRMVSS